VFERAGMPPASQTDVGWVPPEVKKRLKEEARARKAAEAEAKAAQEASSGNGSANDGADGKENG
jgi:NADH-quinone oxidoreductase subunit B